MYHRRKGPSAPRKQGESQRTRDLRIALATQYPGSKWWKMAGSEYMERGLPDLFGCVNGYLYAIEVKIDPNWFEVSQVKRLRELHLAGAAAGGVIWSKDQWWWVYVEDMGHKGDRRREKWVPFRIEELIFFRSE